MQDLTVYAQRLGLDEKRFQEELTSHKYRPEIDRDLRDARVRAILGNPVFFFNSLRVDGLSSNAAEQAAREEEQRRVDSVVGKLT